MTENEAGRYEDGQLHRDGCAERHLQGEMSREFGQALSDFTFDMACGGAIRHLAGLGLTAKEVHVRLSFPVSYERVRQAYTKYLFDTGVLLREHPESRCAAAQKTYIYVQEEGKYGKKSFRRVEKEPGPEDGERIYAACDFGKLGMPDGLAALGLDVKQQEYLEGICWDTQTMYHLMNDRMRGIVEAIAGHGRAGGKGSVVRLLEPEPYEPGHFRTERQR